MVVRVASTILSPDGLARVEFPRLPIEGDSLSLRSPIGRLTLLVRRVEEEGDEPIVRVLVSEHDRTIAELEGRLFDWAAERAERDFDGAG